MKTSKFHRGRKKVPCKSLKNNSDVKNATKRKITVSQKYFFSNFAFICKKVVVLGINYEELF